MMSSTILSALSTLSQSLPDWVVSVNVPSSEYLCSLYLDSRDEHRIEIYDANTEEKFSYLQLILAPETKLRLKHLSLNSNSNTVSWVYGVKITSVSGYCVVPVVTTVKRYYIRGWSLSDEWPGSVLLKDLPKLIATCGRHRESASSVDLQAPIEPVTDISLVEVPSPVTPPYTCKYSTLRGPKKGTTCGNPVYQDGYCKQCSKKKGVQKLLLLGACQYMYTRGPKQGTMCGKLAHQDRYCKQCCKKKGTSL